MVSRAANLADNREIFLGVGTTWNFVPRAVVWAWSIVPGAQWPL